MRKTVLSVSGTLASACALCAASANTTARPATTRVSVSGAGAQGNGHSYDAHAISADGRFVAFESLATNLVGADTNGAYDVFVRDRQTGATTRVSVSSAGAQATDFSEAPSISGDGRYVAFQSNAANLVPGDTNGNDVFVHDRQTGATTRVSVASAGTQGNQNSFAPSISADGRFVAFYSLATDLVPGPDTNGGADVFIHDRATSQTTRISQTPTGAFGAGASYNPSVSADGRFVAFWSDAPNLVAGDTNGAFDVFLHDRQTGTTTRVSVSSLGAQGNAESRMPSISADGRFVAFFATATNLVAGDTNNAYDVFVHDTQTATTTRVSVSSSGSQALGQSIEPSISADGRRVAFQSPAANLVAGDVNARGDVFVHDRQTGVTTLASVTTAGAQGDSHSFHPAIAHNGRHIVFYSLATNLVPGDTNDLYDTFVRDTGSCPGDANGDGAVDFTDLNLVLSDFGLVGPGLAGDLDADGDCDFTDLNIVLGAFGAPC